MEAKKTQVVIISCSAVLAGIAIAIMIRRHSAQVIVDAVNYALDHQGQVNSMGQSLTAVDTSSLPSATFPIKPGDAGIQVANVQTALNKKYQAQLPITGVLDEATLEALCKWEVTWCVFGVGTSLITIDEVMYARLMTY